MLDLQTTLVFVVALTAMNGVVSLIVWLSHRDLDGLGDIAGAYSSFAAGMLVQIGGYAHNSPVAITVANILVNTSLYWLANGLAASLGRRRVPWAALIAAAVTLVAWGAAFHWVPDHRGLRILLSAAVDLPSIGFMLSLLARDRTKPRRLRILMIGLLIADIVVTGGRVVNVLLNPAAAALSAPVEGAFGAWLCLFGTFYFLCLMVLTGLRLTEDLRARNQDLQDEIAHRRTLEAKLSAALATESRLRAEQRDFLHMVSHEFRTPLAAIGRAAEMVEVVLPGLPEAAGRRLATIREAVRHMFHLIDQLLLADRSNQRVVRPEILDIRDLVDQALGSFDDAAVDERIRVELPGGPVFCRVDRTMMLAVLTNIIDNALKYSAPDAPVSLVLAVERDELRLSVADRGIGIPPDELGMVTERFFRASNATPISGTGLGLYTARRFLNYHHGRLDIRSPPGQGTMILIALPLNHAELGADPGAGAGPGPGPGPGKDHGPEGDPIAGAA